MAPLHNSKVLQVYQVKEIPERSVLELHCCVEWPSNLHSHHSQHIIFQNLTTNLYILVHEHSFNKCLILTA